MSPAADPKQPRYVKPLRVTGNKLVFRDATVEDAEFILSLRTDERKSRYLSYTPPDLAKQVQWLERYSRDDSQIYFLIETLDGQRAGTVRLYDQRGSSFCWGSWIKASGAPSGFGIESALMVYHFALDLGFDRAHFEVKVGNASVCAFHERFGAKRVRVTDEDVFYEIDRDAIVEALERNRKFLPDGVEILYRDGTRGGSRSR